MADDIVDRLREWVRLKDWRDDQGAVHTSELTADITEAADEIILLRQQNAAPPADSYPPVSPQPAPEGGVGAGTSRMSGGCICPVGAEATCQGPLCPRRPVNFT